MKIYEEIDYLDSPSYGRGGAVGDGVAFWKGVKRKFEFECNNGL